MKSRLEPLRDLGQGPVVRQIIGKLEEIEAELMVQASSERFARDGTDPFYEIAELVADLKHECVRCL